MPRVWIDDGLGRTATIQPPIPTDASGNKMGEEPPPPVTIQYRPPTSNALLKFEAATSLPSAGGVDALYEFLAAHLTDWDILDGKDQKTKPTLANLYHVPPSYLFRMRNEICDSVERTAVKLKN